MCLFLVSLLVQNLAPTFFPDKSISVELKNLLSRMLAKQPNARIDLHQIRDHAWLQLEPKAAVSLTSAGSPWTGQTTAACLLLPWWTSCLGCGPMDWAPDSHAARWMRRMSIAHLGSSLSPNRRERVNCCDASRVLAVH